jgi:hypothetical protein
MLNPEHQNASKATPPVLLKRLGNVIEANLARARLESAGIPSFLGEQDVFSGGSIHAGSRHGVEIYVPANLQQAALEVLDEPPELSDPYAFEPIIEDPGRSQSFRAVVTAVIGWLVIVLHPVGAFVSIGLHVYAIYLACTAVKSSYDRDLTLRARVVVAVLVSVLGLAAAVFLLAGVLGE